MSQKHSDEGSRARQLQFMLNGAYGPAIKILVTNTTDAQAVLRAHGDLTDAMFFHFQNSDREAALRQAKVQLSRYEVKARKYQHIVEDLGDECEASIRSKASEYRERVGELAALVARLDDELPDPRKEQGRMKGRRSKVADRLLVAKLAGIFETHTARRAIAVARKNSSVLGRSEFVLFLQALPNVFAEPPVRIVTSTLKALNAAEERGELLRPAAVRQSRSRGRTK